MRAQVLLLLFSAFLLLLGIGALSDNEQACSGTYCITIGHPYEVQGDILIGAGVLGIIVGLAVTSLSSGGGTQAQSGTREGSPRLSDLGRATLQYLSEKKNPAEIAELTKVEPAVVAEKIANLQSGGFISQEGYLTEKGFEALQRRD